MPLVIDDLISHERFESSSDLSINGQSHYPNDVDGSSHEVVTEIIRKYPIDYNNNHPNTLLSPSWLLFLVRPGGSIVTLCVFYFYKIIRKLTLFFCRFRSSSYTGWPWPVPLPNWNLSVGIFWLRIHHYGLFWISTSHLWSQDHTLTNHTHKPLVY